MRRCVAMAFLFGLAPVLAQAHNYLDPNRAGETHIPDIAVSRVVYRLLSAGEVHRYGFTASAGQELFIQLLGPTEGPDALHAPTFALIARGHPLSLGSARLEHGRWLDAASFRKLVGAGDADGLLVVAGEGAEFEPFFEPFTSTGYRIRQTLSLSAPAEGSYELVVFDPAHGSGRYVLATGRRERFGPGDLLRFPSVWLEVRRFMGESTAPLWVALGVIGAAAVGGTALLILHRAR